MMFYIILLPIIIALVILFLGMKKRIRELEEKLSSDPAVGVSSVGALEERNRKMKEKKEEYKNKILELLRERDGETPSNSPYSTNRGRITNDDVQQLLGVSDASATNYLSELEKEAKIRQIGVIGHAVYYEPVNG